MEANLRVTRKVLQKQVDKLESATGKYFVLDRNSNGYYSLWYSNEDRTVLDRRIDSGYLFAPGRKPREMLAWIKGFLLAMEE